MGTFWANYKVISSDGYSLRCEELSEAESEADRVSDERGRRVWVLKLPSGKVVYEVGSDNLETDN